MKLNGFPMHQWRTIYVTIFSKRCVLLRTENIKQQISGMEFKTSLILVYILNSVIFYNTYILATDSFTGCYSKQIKDFGGCLTEESSMWTFQSISSRQCAAFCIRDTVCVSFFYKQNIGCLGFDNVLSSVSKNLSTSGWRYYVTCKGKKKLYFLNVLMS